MTAPKPKIWLIDTSVFLNILDIPRRNQEREEIFAEFRQRIQAGDKFFLPYATIVETGNFIAQCDGNLKFEKAKTFEQIIQQAIEGEVPFTPLDLPELDQLKTWLPAFPAVAGRGIGFADFSIQQKCDEQRQKFPQFNVHIWSLDKHLASY